MTKSGWEFSEGLAVPFDSIEISGDRDSVQVKFFNKSKYIATYTSTPCSIANGDTMTIVGVKGEFPLKGADA